MTGGRGRECEMLVYKRGVRGGDCRRGGGAGERW